MSNGFFSGRHHRVIGSHNNNHDIGYLRTTCTHGSKRLMSRCIEEGNLPTVRQLHIISTDMLGNTSCLTSNDVGLTDIVKQRCFTVVNMSHHSNNRCARNEVGLFVFLLRDCILHFGTDIFGRIAELICHNVDGFRIQALVN